VLVSFVDNHRKEIYGQRFIDGEYSQLDGSVERFVAEALESFQEVAGRCPSSSPADVPAEEDLVKALRGKVQ
jgi:hypothetical protein